MHNAVSLGVFLILVTAASVFWGRVNRLGYSRVVTSLGRFIMKYSKIHAELLQSYLVWSMYLLTGLVAALALLTAYQVNLLHFIPLATRYVPVIPLAFIAQNSLTGLMMQLWLVSRPASNVFADLTSIPWVSYTLMMPRVMRMLSPLSAAIIEEVFFRGAVFLILIHEFPQTGAYLAIVICTASFVLQQVLQTDTVGQAAIFVIGSTSISVVGCITILYTGSFLPTLLCHAAYSVVYLQLGRTMRKMPNRKARKQGSTTRSAYPTF
jgi:hypothetical protein